MKIADLLETTPIGDLTGNLAGEVFNPSRREKQVRVPRNDVTPKNPAVSPTSGVIMRKDPMVPAPMDPIFEVLNSPSPYQWERIASGGESARFQVDDIGYKVDFMNGNWKNEPVVTIQYTIDKASMGKLGVNTMTNLTGLGTPLPVLSTILQIVQEWFQTHHPSLLFFYDGEHSRSRAQFYSRAANMIMKQYGYELDSDTVRVRRQNGNPSVWLLRSTI